MCRFQETYSAKGHNLKAQHSCDVRRRRQRLNFLPRRLQFRPVLLSRR